MDYQINIYPSNARELQNVKADNNTKQIKVVTENKLQNLYKQSFNAAVKKFNERVTTGKLIDNYYQSILESNIPEVYKLTLVVRYELLNKNEMQIIQKAFTDFKKALEKLSYLKVVSVYFMSYEEYKEMQVFFYPVSEGYSIGLAVRNDLIDVTKKLHDIDKQNMNIAEAMPLFEQHIESIFAPINNGNFVSQEELEAMAHNIVEEDPLELHSIAVETLKAYMNSLQKVNAENQKLEEAIQSEKERIEYDLTWVHDTTEAIHQAEAARIAEERRLREEAIRAEAARRAAEAQRREEERLREEERRIEAARLAEQARRNIELRRQMAMQEKELAERRMSRKSITHNEFIRLIEMHIQWQEFYEIDENIEYDSIPREAVEDARRLCLSSADIDGVSLDMRMSLIGVSFSDCEFTNSKLCGDLIASSIENCTFTACEIGDIALIRCAVTNINVDRLAIDNLQIDDSMVMKVSARNTVFSEFFSSPATTYIRCKFEHATFKGCDLKKNTFTSCNFSKATFSTCDLRNSVFQLCYLESMNKEGSLFKGVKINEK